MPKGRRAFIITNPMIAANRSAEVTLSKFLRVIGPCYDKVTVIGGNLTVEADLNDVELISFDIVRAGNKIRRALDILGVQIFRDHGDHLFSACHCYSSLFFKLVFLFGENRITGQKRKN